MRTHQMHGSEGPYDRILPGAGHEMKSGSSCCTNPREENVYCEVCECEFVGWTGRCPACGASLTERVLASPPGNAGAPLSYEALVQQVGQNGGQLRIDLSTTDIGIKTTWSFPYSGHGFAWARRMQGHSDGLAVDLLTAEVGTERKHGFPYSGYRFAWARTMEGQVGGNALTLIATQVVMEKKHSFPYYGYGFAWTQEMAGECGPQLEATFLTTDVGRRKQRRFPYRGYGFAWAKEGVLTLTLREQRLTSQLSSED
jgi:hypothetical protein